MLTVRKALTLEPLSLGTVVAGEAGLDRLIENITVLEIPDVPYFLVPNLLAISSLYAIASDVPKQLDTIRLLNDSHASALLLFNVGRERMIPYLSPELLALCDELAFPLVMMPLEVSYASVFDAVLDQLMNYQVRKLQNSIKIYESYTNQLLSSDGSYSSLFSTLGDLIHHGVKFYNHNQRCIFSSFEREDADVDALLLSALQANVSSFTEVVENQEFYVQVEDACYLLTPIVNQYSFYGAIAVENVDQPISDTDRLAITQTGKALCITMFGKERMDKYRERIRNEFLRDLLPGNIGDRQQVLFQSKALDLDVEHVSGLLVASPFTPTGGSRNSFDPAAALETLYTSAKRLFPESIIFKHDEACQLIIFSAKPNAVEKELPYMAKTLSSAIQAVCGAPMIGVSPPCEDVVLIPRCYAKTVSVMRIAQILYGVPKCVKYETLEMYDLLYNSIDKTQASAVVSRLLAPVRQYDAAYNTQLEDTFSKLLESNSTLQVSQEMYLHKNTVLQRKNKIQSLYAIDPFCETERLRFSLAFLLQKLFSL